MNRRDFLKSTAAVAAAIPLAASLPFNTGAPVEDGLLSAQSFVAESLSVQSFIADEEYVGVPSGCYRTCALIVGRTDTAITVQVPSGSDPIFVENGVVSSRNFVRSDGNLFLRQAWLTVHNYRPNDDGTQTWDIELWGGDISDVVVQSIAYHYGAASDYEDAGVYEVASSEQI